MPGVSMKQIAAEAGVSLATVSRVLNDNPSVHPDLRKRVMDVVRRYDYEPNVNARSLHSRKTGLIALVIPDISNPFFPGIAKAAEEVANLHGYNMILCNTDGKLHKEESYFSLVRRRQVDGMIFLPVSNKTEHVKSLVRRVPVVTLDRQAEGIACVRTDNEHGGYLVTRHLVSVGHTRIACIAASWDPKVKGYHRALIDAGITPDPDLFVEVTQMHARNPGYEGTRQLLAQDYPPTAIMAASDVMAAGVYMALEENGLRVSQDVAVTGYDNTMLATTMRPALTTVAQPNEELGRLSAQMLLDAIDGRCPEIRTVVLEPRLVVRDSTSVRVATVFA